MIPVLFLLIVQVFFSLTNAVAEPVSTPISVIVSKENQNVFSVGQVPDWVISHEVALEYVPPKPSEVNSQCLLLDRQENWLEKATYVHIADKGFTQTGIENLSEISIILEPAYQQAIVHYIRVYRDGQWLDRLQSSRHELIHKKDPSGVSAYTGEVELVYFLNDIRSADVIEYAYTVLGEIPLLNSHYTNRINLQRFYPVEQISYSLLAHDDFSFTTRQFNTEIEPIIEEVEPSLKRWSWTFMRTSERSETVNTPHWYDSSAHIICSQYNTWEEVSKAISALYTLPDNFEELIPDEMATLVESWKNTTTNAEERALLACRFVQEQIRYLSLADGVNGKQPQSPCSVFNDRFGDCKGKTFLLHAFLRLMQIESHPVLVHSTRGRAILEGLPSPWLTNHCVLQIKIDGATYWVDPVITFQGGSLATNFFPDYTCGLLLLTDSEALVPTPPLCDLRPIEVDTLIILTTEDSAILKTTNVFHGRSADRLRRKINSLGLEELSKAFLSERQKIYGEASIVIPLEYTDSLKDNILTLSISYQVPTESLFDKKLLEVSSAVITSYLDADLNPIRLSPYQLFHSPWIKERIHIENPFNEWSPLEEEFPYKHPSILFTQSMKRTEHSIDYEIELKHFKDYVALEDLKSYWTITKAIKRHAPSVIEIIDANRD